ncbi:MAG: transketolase C-terminal domain-containing protein [Eubacteriales bacterium]|nr:transketolase C-terminal domain-containing protein [Eubacteriales bacterium]
MAVIYNEGKRASGRKAAGNALYDMAGKYDNLWVVVADTGGALGAYKKEYKGRFLDVGIAEQAALGAAAGLALEGNIPFVFGMLPFLALRSAEQLRTAICYQNLPVRIIGTGGGLVGPTGSTHLSMEDIAVAKSMVNLTVIAISDPNMVKPILEKSMAHPGPIFIRLGYGADDPVLYDPGSVDYMIGKGLTIHEGNDVTIFTYGAVTFEALEAAETLKNEGVGVRVIDMFTLKPLDKELIVKAVKETGKIVVLEDHLMSCGLANSIADVCVESGVYPRAFKRLGIPEVYAGFGAGKELRKKYGYDTAATLAAVKEML